MLLAMVLSPAVAHAQDGVQTVENAQKFLSIVLPGNGYMKGAVSTALSAVNGRDASGYYMDAQVHGEAKIIDASSVGRCRSKLLSDYSSVEVELRVRRNPGAPVLERKRMPIAEAAPDGFSAQHGGVQRHGDQAGFSWSELKSVRTVGDNVYLMFAGNKSESVIYLRSADLASRVGYALEFLRLQCDAAAGTGF